MPFVLGRYRAPHPVTGADFGFAVDIVQVVRRRGSDLVAADPGQLRRGRRCVVARRGGRSGR